MFPICTRTLLQPANRKDSVIIIIAFIELPSVLLLNVLHLRLCSINTCLLDSLISTFQSGSSQCLMRLWTRKSAWNQNSPYLFSKCIDLFVNKVCIFLFYFNIHWKLVFRSSSIQTTNGSNQVPRLEIPMILKLRFFCICSI